MIHVEGLFCNQDLDEGLRYGHFIGDPIGNNDWPDYDLAKLPPGAPYEDSRKLRTLTEMVQAASYLRKQEYIDDSP